MNIARMHLLMERFHPRFLVVGQKHGLKTDLLKPAKQRDAAPVSRRSVRHQRIVDIEDHPAVSLPVQLFIINLIGGIQIMIRIKPLQQCKSHSNSPSCGQTAACLIITKPLTFMQGVISHKFFTILLYLAVNTMRSILHRSISAISHSRKP